MENAASAPEGQDRVGHDGTGPDSAIGGTPTSGTDVPGDPGHSSAVDQPLTDAGDVPPAGSAGDPPVAGSAGGGDPDELERVRTELAERTADLQRVSAEYANYRRRVERDRESQVSGAKAQIAGELLTVLDDVERAGAHGDLTGPFKVVADRLTDVLGRVGLTPFGAEGDAFDPSVHEAVAHETSPEVAGPTVTTVMRRGYRFGDRVLRPAMVGVTDSGSGDAAEPGSAPTPSSGRPDAG